ncbi:MAG: 2-hydroxyacyl-CoA dehydratase [Clostridium sp.]|uniref:2-hydroxyacyl-CoA dehydratase n=1 Tax=Clostridium sp. TaxID=1506 RepID=UPI00290F43F6|nr:2-hydroxyacyl-CoA dehydratase [Clostridium sp.]MDU7336515.1 2-hydroxyacyl-CoA dehydratase [Clostridium sp.]
MAELKRDNTGRILFTKEMKQEYTILCPQMAEIHFSLVVNIFRNCGYNMVLLKNDGPNVVHEGLKYVHNDTCYPALLVIGQFMDALKSGKYDLDRTALIITQTGGGCRASNYIHLLRKALRRAGMENVPVVSLNLSGLEHNPGFSVTLPMLRRIVAGLVYGDLLMLLDNQVKPYEIKKGESSALVQTWIERLSDQFNRSEGYSLKQQKANLEKIAAEFAAIPVERVPKVRVGIVGEIFVKYSPLGNNQLEQFLAEQDCEVNVPGILNFALFKVDNRLEDINLYGGNPIKYRVVMTLMDYLRKMQEILIAAVKTQPCFEAPMNYAHTKALVKDVIGYGNKMGEGWLLTAEMLELVETGFENIVCTQPFGCLPNHICGKGMIRRIKEIDDRANIVPIDYDPSATRVNQENRIKLMLAVAREALKQRTQEVETTMAHS